ncbi:5743_t:CDS:2 [Ambispora leptoticha]|uniref:5743_t:CDS:1 n=1 Tax=Ambispora leptoticha TaxID=144679 RepID=A0A9N8VB85_9GLOM|nr:5743_t:CDS:2 [Ambispora leptoticha]
MPPPNLQKVVFLMVGELIILVLLNSKVMLDRSDENFVFTSFVEPIEIKLSSLKNTQLTSSSILSTKPSNTIIPRKNTYGGNLTHSVESKGSEATAITNQIIRKHLQPANQIPERFVTLKLKELEVPKPNNPEVSTTLKPTREVSAISFSVALNSQ